MSIYKACILAVLSFVISACTTALTKPGESVRLIDEEKADKNCKFLGTASAFDTGGINVGAETDNALNEARNKAASMGGNGIRIINIHTDAMGTNVTVQVLSCAME